MEVASLELSKTLFELSGWKDTEHTYYINGGEYSGQVYHRGEVFDKDGNLPAYSLGYLLRKLPAHTDITKVEAGRIYYTTHHQQFDAHADTPEDATCKLAIELIKQGILPANLDGGSDE